MANPIVEIIIGLKDMTASGLKNLGANLKEIHSKFGALKTAASGVFSVLKSAASVYFAPLKAIAVPAIAAVTTAFGLLIKSVKEWAGQELGEADVKSALVAMGQYTDDYQKKLIDLASTYQDTTGIADDMWLKALGQLTRFGMTSANVDKVSLALRNLTGLMDGNVEGAADMLAKAMQGEFGMFGRMGIVIQKTGDQAKDLATVMDAINAKGKGLLEARANTLAGRWNAIKTQVAEVFEAIGKKTADGSGLGKWLDLARDKLKALATAFDSGALGKSLYKAAEDFSKKLSDGFAWLGDLKRRMDESGQTFGETVGKALNAAVGVFTDALAAAITSSFAIWKMVGAVIFNSFKENFLKVDAPWLGGLGGNKRVSEAKEAALGMPDNQAKDLLNKYMPKESWRQYISDHGSAQKNLAAMVQSRMLGTDAEAAIGASTSAAEIEAAVKELVVTLKSNASTLGSNTKTAVEGVVPTEDKLKIIKTQRQADQYQKSSENLEVNAKANSGPVAKAMLDQAREYATMASNLNQLVAQLKESNAVIAGMAADQANQNAKLRSQQANNRT
jgi:hypothetical protein